MFRTKEWRIEQNEKHEKREKKLAKHKRRCKCPRCVLGRKFDRNDDE